MVEILLFIIFIMMCPRVPDPRCGSGARAYFLSGMALVAKVEAKKLIYWEVAFKSNSNFKISKFLSRRAQVEDYTCMHDKSVTYHASVKFVNSRRYNNL